ncbi:MAG: hypothetical protein EA424_23590 [Planctomycetaceae bacterium]|nr:MAG: hypothetical protein EA424_23590 [Planctomycetaceae bacterium]
MKSTTITCVSLGNAFQKRRVHSFRMPDWRYSTYAKPHDCVHTSGNNFNNRSEEAIGTAQDIWTAYREGAFPMLDRPWLGYLLMLERCPRSTL